MTVLPKEKRRRGPKPIRQISSAAGASPSPQRKHLTYHDRLEILDYCHSHRHLTQSDIAHHFRTRFPSITQSTISRYLSQEDETRQYIAKHPQRAGYTRPVNVTLPPVEEAIGQWVTEKLDHGHTHLTGGLICEKARQFSELLDIPDSQRYSVKFSTGWLRQFKERMGLHRVWYHGEAASAPVERIEPEIQRLQPITGEFAPDDVYDFDETALNFRAAPLSGLSNRPMAGVKLDMSRLTCALAVNFTGSDKRELFILGKVTKPRCFKGHTGVELGFDYDVNKSAWMTEEMWHRWLTRFDADMQHQNRHVLLLCDNASPHKKPKPGQYPNVRVEFLAPRLTAYIQPLDAGIIRCFKAHYRRMQIRRALERADQGEPKIYHIDQLEAMNMARAAWDAVSPTTIQNCWRHTRICPPSWSVDLKLKSEANGTEVNEAISQLQSALDELAERHPDLTPADLMSARRFVDSDEAAETVPEPSDERIATEVSQAFSGICS